MSCVTLQFDVWPWKNNRAPLLCYLKFSASFRSHWWIKTWVTVRKLLGQIWWFLEQSDLAIWGMTLRNTRAPILCYFKLYPSFFSHCWIQTGVTVQKLPIWVKIDNFLSRVTLLFYRWPRKRSIIKLYASFHHHMWIQTGVTVGKCLIWVKFDDF